MIDGAYKLRQAAIKNTSEYSAQQKLARALQYLGDKWVLSKANRAQKLNARPPVLGGQS